MKEKLEDKANNSKYYEKYVAMVSFRDNTIVSYGKNPSKVFAEAERKGYVDPVLFYVHDPKIPCCYRAA